MEHTTPDVEQAARIRARYKNFRILVIGRANAGKTTLLKRVCNTTEDPCIYDEQNKILLAGSNGGGFEAGDERQLKQVLSFINERARATNVNEQLHAIWFCLKLDKARSILDLEKKFFDNGHVGNVPVIAIFTKFDDFVIQVYDTNLSYDQNWEKAETLVKNIIAPLSACKYPPRADVIMEALNDNAKNHQEQIAKLIKKTADSLDNLALTRLFISVQQSNLAFSIEYAVKYSNIFDRDLKLNVSEIK
ncbi:hypothetical protein H0H92_004019 [Tricholoma furcatifolium]|nr:hypothetical protein H0H92_004019 [Tricholoma furcatifolium]